MLVGVILYILLSGKPPFYGQCGQQCGWDEGGSCYTCQTMLCEKIQRGEYEFPERNWRGVSAEAVDLVRRMLVREPHKRASADEVLQHAWFTLQLPLRAASPPELATPRRSLAGLASYAENANAWNRLFAQQHSGAPCSVSCYLPSPHIADRLTQLLELDAESSTTTSPWSSSPAPENPSHFVASASIKSPLVPLASFDCRGAETAAGGDQLPAALYVRPRSRAPTVGATALVHAARRRRLTSRSIDAAMTASLSWTKTRADHREPIEVRE